MARERDGGFTLLEVLVAFIIAAMALGVLFGGAVEGMRSVRLSTHYQEALSRARSRLATIGHAGPLVDGDQQGDDGGGFHWHTRVSTIASAPMEAADATGQGPRAALHAVDVVISWQGDGGDRQVALSSERVGLAVRRGP